MVSVLREGWEIRKLGEVCDFQGGSQPPKSQFIYEFKEGYIRFLQIRDFKNSKNITYIPESNKNKYCNEHDVLLGRYGASVGKVLVNKAGAYNVAVMKTIPNKELLLTRYLFFYLTSSEFQKNLLHVASRSAQDGFSKKDIFNFSILIPPLQEQEKIVTILDEAFTAIDKAKVNTELNLQNAKELFESYLQGIFENKGEGWEEKTLSEICTIKHGFAFKSKYFSDDGSNILLTPGNFYESGGYRDRGHKQKYYNGEFPSDYMLKEGDLLVVMTEQAAGLLGSPLIVPYSNKFLHNQRLGLIQSKSPNKCSNEFLFHIFNTSSVRKNLYETGTGIKVRHTSPTKIGNVVVFYPTSPEVQNRIIKTFKELLAETKKLEIIYTKKLQDLDELKKSILQKAFNGELT